VITAPAAAAGAALAGLLTGCSVPYDRPAPAGTTTPPSPPGSRTPVGAGAGQPLAVARTPPPAASGPATVTATTFTSAARRRQVGMVIVAPADGGRGGTGPGAREETGSGVTRGSGEATEGSGGRGLPVCVVLHGRGDDARRAVGLLGLDLLLADAIRAGVPPFALVTVDGGTAYWHRRASGDDPEAMILDEVRPRLAASGLRTGRLAMMGWSMGGYGVLLLARRHPEVVVAAAASSPAMWQSFGASAPGAFDSAADFAAHRVLGTAPAPGVTYRIDCGNADPFAAVSRQAVTQLRPAEHSLGPGGHTPDYWRSVAPAQLAFIGTALARAA